MLPQERETGTVPGSSVEIVEVSPRDGLQAEDVVLATDVKIELINRVVAAGARRVEVCSFVNPKRVPQMADADAVLAALPHRDDVRWIGLVLNVRGFERARDLGMREINVVAVASDTFAQNNQGTTSVGTVRAFEDIAPLARDAGMFVSLTISASFGCPYEGEVPVERVVDIARRASEAGANEIALADSIGAGVPTDVIERVAAVRPVLASGVGLRAHFHNTRNTGLANAYAAVEAGIDALDSSLGGVGGCPFAPNATGNIPTEDLAYLLQRMGVETGLDLAKLAEVVLWIEEQLGKRVPGLLSKAGLFPKLRTG
jgi:hydroxymethylglutaryl-CoA lyase